MICNFHGLYCWEETGHKDGAVFMKSQKICLCGSLLRILLIRVCWSFAFGFCWWWELSGEFRIFIFFFSVCRSPQLFCLRSTVWLLVRQAEAEDPLLWILREIATLILMCNEDNRSKGLRLLNPVVNSWVILKWSVNLFRVFLQNSTLILLCFYILLGDKVCP